MRFRITRLQSSQALLVESFTRGIVGDAVSYQSDLTATNYQLFKAKKKTRSQAAEWTVASDPCRCGSEFTQAEFPGKTPSIILHSALTGRRAQQEAKTHQDEPFPLSRH
ncbi:hypothetical protein DNTS_021463 [Danionella cerebrum]|uniref:Uncharacterized protein n=1 Tax=Danionella cerebrum TaxID=2873325 RepID=A0A553R2N3_9TELE|nr:hypothetical protein DNTS_021463 [Danionella translucida]